MTLEDRFHLFTYAIFKCREKNPLDLKYFFCIKWKPFLFKTILILDFQNKPLNLYPSYKTDIDFWDCFGRGKTQLISELHRTYLDIQDHLRGENPVL